MRAIQSLLTVMTFVSISALAQPSPSAMQSGMMGAQQAQGPQMQQQQAPSLIPQSSQDPSQRPVVAQQPVQQAQGGGVGLGEKGSSENNLCSCIEGGNCGPIADASASRAKPSPASAGH